MIEIVRHGAGLLFMKAGTHAQEALADIVARKHIEIANVGYTLWGYGGNTCHPRTMVQPFARTYADRELPIHLVMEETHSSNLAEPLCAAELSEDGLNWQTIPDAIEVRGSQFALVIRSLDMADFELSLNQTIVAIGPSRGRAGSRYIRGRVDKACLEVLAQPVLTDEDPSKSVRPIHLMAELMKPYAVFLRNSRPQK